MTRTFHLLALTLGIGCGLLMGLTVGAGHAETRAPAAWEPPAHTIVAVEGDKANGFGIHYYDGSSIYPPTDSEALAECGEYDTRVARVRCRTEVRIWYRDLGQLKLALRYAHHP
ncbi:MULTISPECIES: hypothetical protein [unclassified Nocardioides]|uniref:hypothetical protein n=1 Tax=unclassified Nocardioides TaxID=2615069 RepID=UPI000A5D72AF|nr:MULTISPECIES: hypothetical protein [unclassified Nocardioides]